MLSVSLSNIRRKWGEAYQVPFFALKNVVDNICPLFLKGQQCAIRKEWNFLGYIPFGNIHQKNLSGKYLDRA